MSMYNVKNFPGVSPAPAFKGRGRKEGRQGEERGGRIGEGMGREGKGGEGGEHPPNKILRLQH
jgi:hypothetical protein